MVSQCPRFFEGIASREGVCRPPHTVVRSGHGGIRGAPRHVCGLLADGSAPVLSRLVWPAGGLRAHGGRGREYLCRTQLGRTMSWLSAGINKALGGCPHPHDDVHRYATGRTAGHAR